MLFDYVLQAFKSKNRCVKGFLRVIVPIVNRLNLYFDEPLIFIDEFCITTGKLSTYTRISSTNVFKSLLKGVRQSPILTI